MSKFLAAVVVCGLCVSPAFAANEKVETAIKAFDQVGADAAKLKIYCDMSKLMSSSDDDEGKAEALDKQMQDYMQQLGPEFENAFEAGADLDPDSEDGKTYDAALDKLDAKCGN